MMRQIAFVLFLLMAATSCQSQQSAQTLNASAFDKQLKASENPVVLAVRTEEEYGEGHLTGAMLIDYTTDSFEAAVAKLDKEATYFVYCLSGGRSGRAADYMRKNGFAHVYDLKGGVLAWQQAGLSLDDKDAAPVADKISTEAWQTLITRHPVVLVDFYAPWCVPCREMEPMLTQLAEDYKGKVSIVRLNIDENRNLAGELGITEIPLFRLYRNGQQTWEHQGKAEQEELTEALDQ